jgi:MtN3 and saliva related transmembrane protein
MTTTTALGVAVTAFGVAMGLSPILQLRTVVRRRSSDDVSVPYLLVLLVGFALWLAYGLALGNTALIVSNAVALATYTATTAAVLRFRGPSSVV